MGKIGIKKIKEAMFKAMSGKTGRDDLWWLDCLFDYGLAGGCGLNVSYGELEERTNEHPHLFEDRFLRRRVYDYHNNSPIARLSSPNMPGDYWLFVIGPQEFRRGPLRLVCIPQAMDSRDTEEFGVLRAIDKRVCGQMRGKHKNVTGKLVVPREQDWDAYSRVLEKSFGPIVEPPANFDEDIYDILVSAKMYSGFEGYQQGRDRGAEATAEKIIADACV